jgi:hypothetical protein
MFSFTCECLACREDYPRSTNLPRTYLDDNAKLIPGGCGNVDGGRTDWTECPGCSKTLQELESNRAVHGKDVFTALGTENASAALAAYTARLEADCRHLASPHFNMLSGRAAIIDCIAIMHGKRAKGVVEKCMSSVYG